MSESSEVVEKKQFKRVVEYMRAHWPSTVKSEWQVKDDEYAKILLKVLEEWTKEARIGRKFVRIAGQSGTGKTSQLLPAVQAWFGEERPILVAARKFVQYHPFVEELRAEYGEADLRKKTDEFATIMMFLTLHALMQKGYDIILDVTLLDKRMEEILVGWLKNGGYEIWMTMVAVSPRISEKWLSKRVWRHSKATEDEFQRATGGALEFYAQKLPDMRVVLWSAWDLQPVYDGAAEKALEVWKKYMEIDEVKEDVDTEVLKEAKIKYLGS